MEFALLLKPSFWLVAGAVLLGLELLVSAYLFLSFGLSALATAALVLILPDSLLEGGSGLIVALLAWTGISLVIWLIISRRYARGHQNNPDINDFAPRVEGTDSARKPDTDNEYPQLRRRED